MNNDGGPAFPQPIPTEPERLDGDMMFCGMSLRDYFAAKAMRVLLHQGMDCTLTGGALDYASLADFMDVAVDSYAMADAMLKARAA